MGKQRSKKMSEQKSSFKGTKRNSEAPGASGTKKSAASGKGKRGR